jgi:hypothetical protein
LHALTRALGRGVDKKRDPTVPGQGRHLRDTHLGLSWVIIQGITEEQHQHGVAADGGLHFGVGLHLHELASHGLERCGARGQAFKRVQLQSPGRQAQGWSGAP